jgi:hypothetical protein
LYFRWGIKLSRKRPYCALVNLKEQSIFTFKMLKDGALRDSQVVGDVGNAGVPETMLGKVSYCNVNDLRALHRGSATSRLQGAKRPAGDGDENAAVMTLGQYSEITARKYYEADEIESTMCAGF